MGMLPYKFESPSRRGVPDLLVLVPGGGCFFIEVKNPSGTGRLSELQKHEIERIREHGHTVYIIDNRAAALDILTTESAFAIVQ